jgi:hypothetical protein
MVGRDLHPSERDLLLAVDREHTGLRQLRIDAHLQGCDTCRERLAGLQATCASVAEVYVSAAEADDRDPRRRARLAAALDRASEEWETSGAARLRGAWAASQPWARVAAVAALVAVTAIVLRSQIAPDADDRFVASSYRVALPIAALTPGAVAPISTADLCAGARPSRRVSADVRDRVLRDYGMHAVAETAYELDALITPELGGSTDRRNLWPQRYESPVWNARVKDELEELLPRLVCDGRVALAVAQREIATDWIAAYQKYFNTKVPLQAHLGPAGADDPDDDDELEILPVVYQTLARR